MMSYIPQPPRVAKQNLKEAVYTVEQISAIIDMIEARFMADPETFQVSIGYGDFRVKCVDSVGELFIGFPNGPFPHYIQLSLAGIHSWTNLDQGFRPLVNYKLRRKLNALGKAFSRKNEIAFNKAREEHIEMLRQNGYAAIMKAFPEITDKLLEDEDGRKVEP